MKRKAAYEHPLRSDEGHREIADLAPIWLQRMARTACAGYSFRRVGPDGSQWGVYRGGEAVFHEESRHAWWTALENAIWDAEQDMIERESAP